MKNTDKNDKSIHPVRWIAVLKEMYALLMNIRRSSQESVSPDFDRDVCHNILITLGKRINAEFVKIRENPRENALHLARCIRDNPFTAVLKKIYSRLAESYARQRKSDAATGIRRNWFTASLKKSYDRFVKIRGNPKEIAMGFALGLFIGMSPTMGIQMYIAIVCAAILKWSKIAAAAGVWITNPISAPFVYGLTYYTGAKLLSYKMKYPLPDDLNMDALILMLKQAPEILWIMTVGGVILGIPLAVAGYYFALSAVMKYRENIRKGHSHEKGEA